MTASARVRNQAEGKGFDALDSPLDCLADARALAGSESHPLRSERLVFGLLPSPLLDYNPGNAPGKDGPHGSPCLFRLG